MKVDEITWATGPPDAFGRDRSDRKTEACTTATRRMRHLSADLVPSGTVPGRSGRTLCSCEARDEERTNYWLRKWRSREIRLERLPECQRCHLMAGEPS